MNEKLMDYLRYAKSSNEWTSHYLDDTDYNKFVDYIKLISSTPGSGKSYYMKSLYYSNSLKDRKNEKKEELENLDQYLSHYDNIELNNPQLKQWDFLHQ